jgi:hypothetical protein
MNYQERISALENFKSVISAGMIEDNVSLCSEEVSEWSECSSKEKFKTYITKIKEDASKSSGKKADFLDDIDKQISAIQLKFDQEYYSYRTLFFSKDDKDPVKDRQLKIDRLSNLSIDDSVKRKIRLEI